MEILREGKKPAEKEYIATCMNCGTKIKFFRHEATLIPNNREGNYLSIPCPRCICNITAGVSI